MPDGAVIRPYEPADLAALLGVWRRSSDLAHPFLDAEFQDGEAKAIAEVYLPNAETETWVSIEGDRLVGFLTLIGNEVGALFVEPADHGRGLGRALMDHARVVRGRLEVEVFEENAIGRRFYERYGFRFVRRGVHGPSGLPIHRLELDPEA